MSARGLDSALRKLAGPVRDWVALHPDECAAVLLDREARERLVVSLEHRVTALEQEIADLTAHAEQE